MADLKHSYSDALYKQTVLVLGPLPPPLGGVSVHIARVIHKLTVQENKVRQFDTTVPLRYRFFYGYLLKLMLYVVIVRPCVVHLHTLYLHKGLQELRLLVWLKKFLRFQLVVIEHDCRYVYEQTASYKKRLNSLMRDVDVHCYIGNLTAQSFYENTTYRCKQEAIESAFLPPPLEEEQRILATYPQSLFQFMRKHQPLLLINAFQLSLLNGRDLYGFDVTFDALYSIKKEFSSLGLIAVIGSLGNTTYYRQLQEKIKALDLVDAVYWLTDQKELWPLLKKVDLFIRPTLSDGYSVSIEEALYFGIPVVASDVCARPAHVTLFKTGDAQDLYKKIRSKLGEMHGAINQQRHTLHP